MVSVQSLLNPVSNSIQGHNAQTVSPPPSRSATYSHDYASPSPAPKKLKLAKDAPIFSKGTTKGEVRFPPHEERTPELLEEHKKFQMYPLGHIGDYCRHIPYNSEKKSFMGKTGRESFEGIVTQQLQKVTEMLIPRRSLSVHFPKARRRT